MLQIPGYEIISELGKGGMGIVYQAKQLHLNRTVALKILNPAWAEQQSMAIRFRDEGVKLAKLSHNAIVSIYDFGEVANSNSYYLALEFIDGEALDKILAQTRLNFSEVVKILISVAEALEHAHEAGIVHRDIKPGNIFVQKDGRIVLGDFGIAKDITQNVQGLTGEGGFIGTPAYMSPEQGVGYPVTPASDIYSLGILAYEMVTGRVPFTADTHLKIIMKHVGELAQPISSIAHNTPPALCRIIESMISKDNTQRPQNGKELVKLLNTIKAEIHANAPTLGNNQPSAISNKLNPIDGESIFSELEITTAGFELIGFSSEFCQKLLPARVAFLLESWYRLVRQSVQEQGGVIDRFMADRAITVFGFPNRYPDHAQRALNAVNNLSRALTIFNACHDLELKMRVGIACGPAMVGQVIGDVVKTSIQGELLSEMIKLLRDKSIEATVRVNRSVYMRTGDNKPFTKTKLLDDSEAWVVE